MLGNLGAYFFVQLISRRSSSSLSELTSSGSRERVISASECPDTFCSYLKIMASVELGTSHGLSWAIEVCLGSGIAWLWPSECYVNLEASFYVLSVSFCFHTTKMPLSLLDSSADVFWLVISRRTTLIWNITQFYFLGGFICFVVFSCAWLCFLTLDPYLIKTDRNWSCSRSLKAIRLRSRTRVVRFVLGSLGMIS